MANSNTRKARKGDPRNGVAPNSCWREFAVGTGEFHGFGYRDEAPIFKGVACDTSRRGRRKWVGAEKAARSIGKGDN